MRLCGPGSSHAGHSAGASGFYHPRRATETPFYRLVAGHFGEFKRVYAQRYEKDFGFWRPVVEDVVRKFLECGDLTHGFARVRCPDCRHNRKLLGKLARCAWRTVRDVYAFVLGDEAIPGAVLAIQTFGSLILWNSHIHAIITDGAFLPDGIFVPMPNTPTAPFLKVWEHHVFKMLIDEGRITPDVAKNMQMWSHSGFSVHKDIRIEAGDTDGLTKLTQYIARCPFAQSRMVKVTPEGRVLYRADHHNPIPFPQWRALPTVRTLTRNFEIFDPLDFLAQVTQHIPDRGQHIIRYAGWYSNKARGCRAKTGADADENPLAASNTSPPTQARLRWAALIRKVYEVDPLVCPKCGGEMNILAFIDDAAVVRKILDHLSLSLSSGTDPPPAHSPPPTLSSEPFMDDMPWGEHAIVG